MKLGVCNDSSTKVLVFKQARFYLTKGVIVITSSTVVSLDLIVSCVILGPWK